MTVEIISNQHRQVAVDIVSPAAQASTNIATVLAGSEIDARMWNSLSYTLKNINQTITYWVYGANAADYSDEVIVAGPTDILAAAVGSYSIAPPPYAHYRAKIKSKVDDVHGTVTLNGIAKG